MKGGGKPKMVWPMTAFLELCPRAYLVGIGLTLGPLQL